MPFLPAALALLAAGALLAGATFAPPDAAQGGRRPSIGTVAAQAGPRLPAAVPPSGLPVGVPPGPTGGPVPTATGFGWPVTGEPSVLHRFAPGPHPWSPGHRGVDVTGGGPAVRAAGPGTVTFAGTIAGRGVVVVRHAGTLRTTYEPVLAEVPVGRTVVRGQQIGVLQPALQHCAGQPCLHWGARSGNAYLDPLSLLTGARSPPVLLPLGITAGRA